MLKVDKLLVTLIACFFGCADQKPVTPIPAVPQSALEVTSKIEEDINLPFAIEQLKAVDDPHIEGTEWNVGSPLNWSTFTMEFPDNDHIPERVAKAFKARTSSLTVALAPTVEKLTAEWLTMSDRDDVVVKARGVEIAVSGYRGEGVIRVAVAFTADK